MSHGYVKVFEEDAREPEKIENKPDYIGLGCFNKDNAIHSTVEKLNYFRKHSDLLSKKKKEAEEMQKMKEVIEYEGD